MEPWTGVQHAFAVKAFYKNCDNFVMAVCEFRREFGIYRNRAVQSVHAIKTWVRNFEAPASTLKNKGSSLKTVRTPENIAVVREAIEKSQHRSARRHSVSLGLSGLATAKLKITSSIKCSSAVTKFYPSWLRDVQITNRDMCIPGCKVWLLPSATFKTLTVVRLYSVGIFYCKIYWNLMETIQNTEKKTIRAQGKIRFFPESIFANPNITQWHSVGISLLSSTHRYK
jgi:hypothetical protein